jgi:hypothetical protein
MEATSLKKIILFALVTPMIVAPAAFLDKHIAHAQSPSNPQTKIITNTGTPNLNTTRVIKPLFDGQRIKVFYMTLGSQVQWQLIENYLTQGYKIDTIVPFRQYYLVVLEKAS